MEYILMISALIFHICLMNLHEMWNEMMKYMGWELVGFVETYLCWNRIYVDVNALILLWDWWIYMNMDQANKDMNCDMLWLYLWYISCGWLWSIFNSIWECYKIREQPTINLTLKWWRDWDKNELIISVNFWIGSNMDCVNDIWVGN